MILAVNFINENEENFNFPIFVEKPNIIDRFWQLRARFTTGLPLTRLFADIQTAITLE